MRRCRCCAPCPPASTTRRASRTTLTLQYGFTHGRVTFLDRLNYFSPYARLTYSTRAMAGESTSPTPPATRGPIWRRSPGPEFDLQQRPEHARACSRGSPLRRAPPKIQRGRGISRSATRGKIGSRTYAVSAYHELVRNAALSIVAPDGTVHGRRYPARPLHRQPRSSTPATHENPGLQRARHPASRRHLLGHADLRLRGRAQVADRGAGQQQSRRVARHDPCRPEARRHGARQRDGALDRHPHDRQLPVDRRRSLGDVGPPVQHAGGRGRLPGLNVYVRQPLPRHPDPAVAHGSHRRPAQHAGARLSAAQHGERTAMLLVEAPRSFRGGLSFIF